MLNSNILGYTLNYNTKCSFCSIVLTSGDERYVCSECKNVNLCKLCYSLPDSDVVHTDSAPHPHFSTLETKTDDEYFENNKSDTFYQCFINAFNTFKRRRCLGLRTSVHLTPENPTGVGDYNWMTYEEVYYKSEIFGTALTNKVPYKSMVGVMLPNIPEWFYIDFGCLFYGYTLVPINHFINSKEFINILFNCDPYAIIVSQNTISKLLGVINKYSRLKMIIYIGGAVEESIMSQLPDNIDFVYYSELMSSVEFPAPHRPLIDGVLALTYSSGSTGTPKGIICKDKDLLASLTDFKLGYPCVQLSFLSLSHLERRADLRMIFNGGRLGIYSLPKRLYILHDIVYLRPTIMWSPPSIWNEIYEKYQVSFDTLKLKYPEAKREELEPVLFTELKNLFGDRIESLVTAGALISDDVLDMMRRCWGKEKIFNLYGSTETMFVSVNDYILPDIQYRIIPIQEIVKEGQATEKPGHANIGELMIKSGKNSSGYYRSEEITKKSYPDGWFHTGDLVEEYEPRKFRVIDRIKNSFKGASGLYICLEKIGNYYYKSELIRHIFVYGDPYRQYLVAIVVPSDKALENHDANLTMNLNEITPLKEAILNDIEAISKEKNVIRYEIPRVIHLDNTLWSMENNLILGSGKINRPTLTQYYLDLVESIYKTNAPESLDLDQE